MSALQNEIDKLNTLKESFSELSKKVLDTQAVLTELNHGKQEMVDALAMKNVQSSTDKTLSAIAGDIRSIAQSPITIDGGEMYEKQLFGAPTDKTNAYEQPDTPMWNLYQVMANLLSDGRFINFQGIVLAEYTKDAESIELNTAGAGGAYLTSDGALYYADVNHTWNDLLDGKSNRWVAYLFASEYKSFEITTTTTPTSIHIGRKVGSITYGTDGRLSDIVVTDGNTLREVNFATGVQNFGKVVSIKNIETQTSGTLLKNNNAVEHLIYDVETLAGGSVIDMPYRSSSNEVQSTCPNIKSMTFPRLKTIGANLSLFRHMTCQVLQMPQLEEINDLTILSYDRTENAPIAHTAYQRLDFPNLRKIGYNKQSGVSFIGSNPNLKEVHFDNYEDVSLGDYTLQSLICGKGHESGIKLFFPKAKSMSGNLVGTYGLAHVTTNVKYILVGCCGDKNQVININIGNSRCTNTGLVDIEIGDKEYIDKGLEPRWKPCQSIYLNSNNVSNKGEHELLEENIVNHILKRLKQDEEMCGSGVTIALGATNLAKLTSDEAVALLDSLTNIYGYTFA